MDGLFETEDGQFWNEPDFLLSLLVSFMGNNLDAEFGVTLMVRGAIITGTLVSERVYLNRMNDLFSALFQPAAGQPDSEASPDAPELFSFEEMAEDAYRDDEDELDDDDDDSLPIRHLHLRDPYILYPNTAMTFADSPVPIMRIRLTAVDGWLPGRVNVIDSGDSDDYQSSFPGHRLKQ